MLENLNSFYILYPAVHCPTLYGLILHLISYHFGNNDMYNCRSLYRSSYFSLKL